MTTRFLSSILSVSTNLLSLIQTTVSSSKDSCPSIIDDLKQLALLLKRIRSLLQDAEERKTGEESVNLWMKELKGVAYDAEDLLDECQYEVLRAVVKARAGAAAAAAAAAAAEASCSGNPIAKTSYSDNEVFALTCAPLHVTKALVANGMVTRIKQTNEKFNEISKAREVLCLREESEKRKSNAKRWVDGSLKHSTTTSSLVNESQVYGRDHDRQKAIEWLFSSASSKLSVMAIVGKGGLGKTTLAKLVYNDENVSQFFDHRIWICTSEDFDIVRILRTMIEYFTMSSCTSSELRLLQQDLQQKLEGKKVLLVLDDVWNENKELWDSLKSPMVAAGRLKIIVTTRNGTVADMMQTTDPYHLSYLSEDQCLLLFQHHAFCGRDPKEFPYLLEIGTKVVRKCGGLPLAVKALGGLLQHEMEEDGWSEVAKSPLWEADEHDEILPALRISYTRMPSYLKPCFLVYSMFPKDHHFTRSEVSLWIAQGYVQPKAGRGVEEVANEYFDELVSRSFIDASGHFLDGRESFKMHDIIHDLARSITEDECATMHNGKLCAAMDEVRHVYIEGREKSIEFLLNMRRLRSLVLENKKFEELPDAIGSLKHLRYLRLESDNIRNLPESIGQLYNLQVMQLLHCVEINDVPDVLGNLINLQDLRLSFLHIEQLPETVTQLHNLRSLDLAFCGHLRELPAAMGCLCNLISVKLAWCRSIKFLPDSISHLSNLQSLDLQGCGQLRELPKGVGNLYSLRYMYLRHSSVAWLPSGIEKLTNLEILTAHKLGIGGVGQLKNLVNLRGRLHISRLENILNSQDAMEANMGSKHKLETLALMWRHDNEHDGDELSLHLRVMSSESDNIGPVVGDEQERRDAMTLQSLQPHINLKGLEIDGYRGSGYPSWIGDPSFAKLTTITLLRCGNEKINQLPTLGLLPSLQALALGRISHLKTIGSELCRPVSCNTEVAFPSLRELVLEYMPDLEKWHGVLGGDFPRIRRLSVRHCPRLMALPALRPKLEVAEMEECPSLRSLSGLDDNRDLVELKLVDCHELQLSSELTLPATLRTLHIRNCRKLASVVRLHNLVSLAYLEVEGCPELQLSPEDSMPQKLKALRVQGCLRPHSLSGLQSMESLQDLCLESCPELHLSSDAPLICKTPYFTVSQCPKMREWCNRHGYGYHENTQQKEWLDEEMVDDDDNSGGSWTSDRAWEELDLLYGGDKDIDAAYSPLQQESDDDNKTYNEDTD